MMLQNYDSQINPPNGCQQLADWEVRFEIVKQNKHRTQFKTPPISWIVVTLPATEVLGLSGFSTLTRGEHRMTIGRSQAYKIL